MAQPSSGPPSARELIGALERERAELLRAALAIASSRSWRIASALSRLGRRFGSHQSAAQSQLDTLIERLVNLELRYGPLQVAEPSPGATAPSAPPGPVDVVLWGVRDPAELESSVEQARRTGAGRIILVLDPAAAVQAPLPDDSDLVAVASASPRGPVADVNAALRLSDAALVVLLRAGLTVPVDWLERLRDAAGEAEEVGLVAAACDTGTIPLARGPRPSWMTPEAVPLLAGRAPGERLRVSVFDPDCLAIPRHVLSAVGGLEPRLSDVSQAVYEFGARLREHGFVCVLTDDLVLRSQELLGAGGSAPAPRRWAGNPPRRPAPRRADRHQARTELRSVLQLEQRISRVVGDPERFAEELAASGRRPLSSLWIASTSAGPLRASAVAAAAEVAGWRALGFDARLAVPATEVSRLPKLDAEHTLGFTDQHHLARLARSSDVVIATHPDLLPVTALARSKHSEAVLACVFRAILQERPPPPLLKNVLLLAPSAWLGRRLAAELGQPVEHYPISADSRYFHPKPDDPSASFRLHVAVHLRPVNAAQTMAILPKLAEALGPEISCVTFGPALATLDRHGVPGGAWREHHVRASDPSSLARLLGRTDVVLDLARGTPAGDLTVAAMACGAVPFVSRGSGAAEVIDHGRDGIVMTTADPDAWRDAVLKLAGDWPRLRSLQTGAIQSATRRSPLRTALAQYLMFEQSARKLSAARARQRAA